MPTENRSSNTELSKIVTEALVGMVSAVTRTNPPAGEPLPGFIQGPIDQAVERIGRLLAQTAAQHQGEPVALPSCKAKLSVSHDWDQGYSDGWKTCLEEIAKLGPLYTHVDTGEVERLRAALKFYADRDHFSEEIGSDWDNVSGEPANILRHEDEAWFVEDGSIARAALSASAEPAPASDGFSAEQMTAQGADGYRNGIKAAAELAVDYPELAQRIRDLPLPQ